MSKARVSCSVEQKHDDFISWIRGQALKAGEEMGGGPATKGRPISRGRTLEKICEAHPLWPEYIRKRKAGDPSLEVTVRMGAHTNWGGRRH